MSSVLDVSLLGTFSVISNGRPVAFQTRKAASLFAYVVANRDRKHCRSKLSDMFWEDRPESVARHNLRQCLTSLRATLLAHGKDVLEIDRASIAVRPDRVSVDADTFRQLAASPDPTERYRAFSLYGEFLPEGAIGCDAFDSWVRQERETVHATCRAALLACTQTGVAAPHLPLAVQVARQLCADDPLDEEASWILMMLYEQQRQRSQAIREYRRLKECMKTELGVLPEARTRQLYAKMVGDESDPRCVVVRDLAALRFRNQLMTSIFPDAKAFAILPVSDPVKPERIGLDLLGPASSSEKLRECARALEQMPGSIIVTDLNLHVVGWNEGAEAEFGFRRRDVLGRRLSFLHGPLENIDTPQRLVNQAMKNGHWKGAVEVTNRDGRIRTRMRHVALLRNSSGQVIGTFGVNAR